MATGEEDVDVPGTKTTQAQINTLKAMLETMMQTYSEVFSETKSHNDFMKYS